MNYSNTIWKHFNDFIEVSSNGEIKSHSKIIKGEKCKNGYIRIHVSDKGATYKHLVHRLVAIVFLSNPLNKPCVNHKDGNKENNCVDNLEWVTYGENLKHAYNTNLRELPTGESNTQSKLTNEDIKYIRNCYVKRSKDYNSAILAKKFNVSPRNILKIVKYKTWNR